MTVPPRWAALTVTYTPALTTVTAIISTDVPCHLWARWAENEPQFHDQTYVIRGAVTPWGLRICFTAYQDLEQTEAGDTSLHTFTWDPWVVCVTRWFYCYGQIAGLKSPSTSGIFKYHNSFVPPPPEEEIMATVSTPYSTGKLNTSKNLRALITKKLVS